MVVLRLREEEPWVSGIADDSLSLMYPGNIDGLDHY